MSEGGEVQGEWGEGRGSKQNDTTFLPRYPGTNIRIVNLGSMSLFSSPADLYPPPPPPGKRILYMTGGNFAV